MFEFLICKKKYSNVNSFIEFDFINVPNSNSCKMSYLIGENICIHLLYHKSKNKEEFVFENDRILILIRGSFINEQKIFPEDLIKSNYLFDTENLKKLKGHFNIVFIDKKDETITLINDYFGLKPVYYGEDNSFNYISSSLHLLKHFDLKIDISSVAEKMLFHHNLLDNTIYYNVKTLKDASILYLTETFEIKQYHDWIQFLANANSNPKFKYSEYRSLFNKKIEILASGEKKSLATLTGGHDGRAVVSGFLKNKLEIETYSFGRKGSENSMIPEMISSKCSFNHTSINLHEDFENQYSYNGLLTIILSDGELLFTQQPTIYSVQKFGNQYHRVFTGLLAGETVGPIHSKTDYINPLYFDCIFGDKELTEIPNHIEVSNYEKSDIINNIKIRINERRNQLIILKESRNSHLSYLADMMTWGFRKFYAYQMHLMRYHLENIPVFYDFDLINLLVNSSYNKIYENSYKSLFHRRNARKLQLNIINNNSKCLANQVIDRGYTPKEAASIINILPKIIKYFIRLRKISGGKIEPDFLNAEWTNLMKNTLLNENYDDRFIQKIKDKINSQNFYILTEKDNIIITNWLFLNNSK